MRDARLSRVRHRAAELLKRRLLAGHRLDHVRTGDEHVRGLLDHENEIGHRRRVHRTPRARPHDQADLRNHARAHHVTHEHVAVGAERHDPLLDPRATRIVDPDHRTTDLGRQVHHLAHLLGHHLAQRAAEDREVLAEHAHPTPVDRPVPRHDRVPPRPIALHLEVRRAMTHKRVQLLKRPRVEQLLDPLASRELPPLMLLRAPRPPVPWWITSSRSSWSCSSFSSRVSGAFSRIVRRASLGHPYPCSVHARANW